ncbi:hypothetical protein [Erwinia tasmaniensis]|uniref:hypothetical protein n=1 Tax=Erwinia tasmaniensis TaxID=338565 RepID=UPI003A4D2E38
MELSRILNGGRAGMLDNNNQPLVQHNVDTHGPPYIAETLFPEINGEPIYSLHNQGTTGMTAFLSRSPAEVENMCGLAVNLVGRSFPPGFNRVDFDFYPRENSSTARGFTESEGDRTKISIGLVNADPGDWKDDFEMHGMIVFTAFHELFLHALPDLRAASHGVDTTSEQDDHDIILFPPHEGNLFYQAVKSVLPGIPSHIKQYFLDSYLDDIEQEVQRAENAPEIEALEQWCDVIKENINRPDNPFWNAS